MREILVVNDDGIYGRGLDPLVRRMKELGEVTVVVPDQERSTASHSLTLHKPLRVKEVAKRTYILNGSPADCTRFGILELLREKADLVVSGINQGLNLGEDVIYSGTVAAAMEATMLEIPALAVSQDLSEKSYFHAAAQIASRIAQKIFRHGLPPGTSLNVNVPALPASQIRGILPTRLGKRLYGKKVTVRSDPRGHLYFWLIGKKVSGIALPGSDVAAIQRGWASMTPLKLDITDAEMLGQLKLWKW